MINKISQHVPGFIDGCIPKERRFHTIEELLNIDWVVRFKEDFDNKKFVRFSLDNTLLIAEYTDNFHWVVGYIEQPALVNLPNFKKGKNPYLSSGSAPQNT